MNATVIRYFVPDSLQNFNHLVVTGQTAAVVDPFDWSLALDVADRHGLDLTEIWLTHGHGDHIRGVPDTFDGSVRGHPDIAGCRITHPLDCDSHFNFNDLRVQVLTTPGHTFDHLCFYCPDIPALIAGDTLFNAGVGNTRGGDTDTLFDSVRKLSKLPGDTQLYSGHDYLPTNLRFSVSVVGEEQTLSDLLNQCSSTTPDNRPITTLADEHRINLFLRLGEDAVREVVAAEQDALSVFRGLRSLRDRW